MESKCVKAGLPVVLRATLAPGLMVAVLTAAATAGPFEDAAAAYRQGDYTRALRIIRPMARKGYARAQFKLGLIYVRGNGVPQDYREALRWYRKAADQGNAAAQRNLGVMFGEGMGVAQDYAEALKWFRRAAEQNDAAAQTNLGVMYDFGHGVVRDYAEALRWYRKAADHGDAEARYNLGVIYERGDDVPQNCVEAVRWYQLAADQGYAAAQSNLGAMYDRGEGIPKNYHEVRNRPRLQPRQNPRTPKMHPQMGAAHAPCCIAAANSGLSAFTSAHIGSPSFFPFEAFPAARSRIAGAGGRPCPDWQNRTSGLVRGVGPLPPLSVRPLAIAGGNVGPRRGIFLMLARDRIVAWQSDPRSLDGKPPVTP